MSTPAIAWPQKTRELQTVIFDSTRWNGFQFRDDDIVIATWAKSGTTWMQQIIGQLIFRGQEGLPINEISPWLDMRLVPVEQMMSRLEAQTNRRFIKTHLPLDALEFTPKAKYLYIGGDGRDVIWSWYNHHSSFTPHAYEMINGIPGRIGPPLEPPVGDVVEYFRRWMDGDEMSLSDFWSHYQGWWDARNLPNVMLVHYNNLKADLGGEMRRIANFLGIEIEEELWPTLVDHCTFDYMKTKIQSPIMDMVFKNGVNDFIYKGTNGRWRDLLTSADIEKYERLVEQKLSPDCAYWLATGEL